MNNKITIYDTNFYREQSNGSYVSAKIIMPIIIDLFSPKSMVDIGCGVGTWLKAGNELGINNIQGYDGDYVSDNDLKIPKKNFTPVNLQNKINSNLIYDLAISLEVGEHIYNDYINNYVDNICSFSKIIMFSGAIPGQGGVNHVSENWPTFWKNHFEKRGYIMIDIIRPKILNNTKVEYWYRQNIFVFIEKKLFNEKYSHLEGNIYSDELYIINKDIIKNPFIFFEKYYNQRIIKFTKKIGIYHFISVLIRLIKK